jgi:hypothetical protein
MRSGQPPGLPSPARTISLSDVRPVEHDDASPRRCSPSRPRGRPGCVVVGRSGFHPGVPGTAMLLVGYGLTIRWRDNGPVEPIGKPA